MYNQSTKGTVISVKKQWWLKVNTRPARANALDGAVFPHIIKVQYTVDGSSYIKRKWISAGEKAPAAGSGVSVIYCSHKPHKAKIL